MFKAKTSRTLLMVLAISILSMSVSAAVPTTMNYQGRLTDGSGNPVADDSYNVTFRIYDGSSTLLWMEGHKITTSSGLFAVILGSNGSPLDEALFSDTERYLGIAVEPDLEMSPQIPLLTVPFAFRTATIDGATGGTLGSDLTVLNELTVGSPTIDGVVRVHGTSGSDPVVDLATKGTYGGMIELYDELGQRTAYIEPDINGSGGFMSIQGGTTSDYFVVNGNYYNGRPVISIGANNGIQMAFNTDESGDATVVLPDNAIHSDEMFNEPGLASANNSGTHTLSTVMSDIETVSIDIPEDGYILLIGQCYVRCYGATVDNRIYVQIDETAGGSYTTPYVTGAGMSAFPSSSVSYYWPVFVQRVYYKSAGTYTFRLEAMKTSVGHTSTAQQATLSAIYLPTGYGAVATLVGDPSGFETAKPVTSALDEDDSMTETSYEVDLRELELRAARLRAEALKAELELIKASAKEQESDYSNKE